MKTAVIASTGIGERSDMRAANACEGSDGFTRMCSSPAEISVVVAWPVRTGVDSFQSGCASSVPMEMMRN